MTKCTPRRCEQQTRNRCQLVVGTSVDYTAWQQLTQIMRTLRIFPVLTVLIFACWSDEAASADSKPDKWLSPAPSAAKKNPVSPTQQSIAAGHKIYSKACAMCHGKSGDADGPAVIELNIHPASLSDPQLDTEPDGSLFWKIATGKKPMPEYGK